MCAHLGVAQRTVRERPATGHVRPALQNAVLARAFPKTGGLTQAEYLDLECMPHALAAFVAAVQFAGDHNATVVARIQRPDIETSPGGGGGEDGITFLDTSLDTMKQLDVHGGAVSLVKVQIWECIPHVRMVGLVLSHPPNHFPRATANL